MTPLDRRTFIRQAAGVAGASMAGFSALGALACGRPHTGLETGLGTVREDYGPLVRAGPELALPDGFRYRRFGITGSLMSDGVATPALHDGMAAFPMPNGNIRLIRNHEVGLRRVGPGAVVASRAYDARGGGGTTSLEISPETSDVVRDYVSLSGTVRNCAGGPTPWGSWLTCEETVAGPENGAERPHGYIFEVPSDAEGPVDPVPLTAMGRFVHEAVAVDPVTGIVYETEDRRTAGFYRFIPERPGVNGEPADLSAGGRLEMLGIRAMPEYDCSKGQQAGEALPVIWVPIDDPDPANAARDPGAVFDQGRGEGGTRFTRVEGCWYGDGQIYFTCTDGGDVGRGQVWSYRPSPEGGTLLLVYESPAPEVLDYPDNVCVSPRGGILLCEDGPSQNFVRGLTQRGRLFDFAQNLESESEFAGTTFSPDGRTLFLNLQSDPGATFAIWGPWDRGDL